MSDTSVTIKVNYVGWTGQSHIKSHLIMEAEPEESLLDIAERLNLGHDFMVKSIEFMET